MIAIIALGSNLGDRAGHLASALKALEELGRVTRSPKTMETPDASGLGPDYLNTVALLQTKIKDPRRLLEALLRIELRLGRDRSLGKNAPRTVDLDLITTDGNNGVWSWDAPADLSMMGERLSLELPHPRAFERVFVLEPWRALSDSDPCRGVIPKK
jgi:2-amino-4-hydroxy-6-hydroxymethyldihydropteridine diphosphokinase